MGSSAGSTSSPENASTSGLWLGLGCMCMLLFTGRVRIQPGFPWVRAAEVALLARPCPPAEPGVRWGARSSSQVPFTVPCKGLAEVIPLSPLLGVP